MNRALVIQKENVSRLILSLICSATNLRGVIYNMKQFCYLICFRYFLCANFYQDLSKLRQKTFSICLGEILSGSCRGVTRNICQSRSWRDVSSFASVINISIDGLRCLKFYVTGLLWMWSQKKSQFLSEKLWVCSHYNPHIQIKALNNINTTIAWFGWTQLSALY